MAPRHDGIDYLPWEVNLLKPNTPFIRDHLKVIRTSFVAWALLTFGSSVFIYSVPATMTVQLLATGFPLHYLLVAMLLPTSSLVLAFIYSRRRDQFDERYSTDHVTLQTRSKSESETAVVDGGCVE